MRIKKYSEAQNQRKAENVKGKVLRILAEVRVIELLFSWVGRV